MGKYRSPVWSHLPSYETDWVEVTSSDELDSERTKVKRMTDNAWIQWCSDRAIEIDNDLSREWHNAWEVGLKLRGSRNSVFFEDLERILGHVKVSRAFPRSLPLLSKFVDSASLPYSSSSFKSTRTCCSAGLVRRTTAKSKTSDRSLQVLLRNDLLRKRARNGRALRRARRMSYWRSQGGSGVSSIPRQVLFDRRSCQETTALGMLVLSW